MGDFHKNTSFKGNFPYADFPENLYELGSVETGMKGSSHPTMKNCESTTGIRNRLLRGQGANFSGI